jgi:hypothetical protein
MAEENSSTEVEETPTDDIQADISDIFTDESEVEVEESPETEEEAKVENSEEESKEEPEETDETTTSEDDSDQVKGLKKALYETRKQLRETKGEKEKVKAPDPIDDPEGYTKHQETEVEQALLKERKNLSRSLMMEVKDDYMDKEKAFLELVGYDEETGEITKNHHLVQQMDQSENPAKFAYDAATDHLETLMLKDPKYIESLVEKRLKEKLAELQANGGKKSATDVPDITTAAAAGNNSEKQVKEVSEINDVFDD